MSVKRRANAELFNGDGKSKSTLNCLKMLDSPMGFYLCMHNIIMRNDMILQEFCY